MTHGLLSPHHSPVNDGGGWLGICHFTAVKWQSLLKTRTSWAFLAKAAYQDADARFASTDLASLGREFRFPAAPCDSVIGEQRGPV
ncbi:MULTISPECIES: hypothetical protein [Mycobacterium]|uniref:Uncharacterized protein n=1 Tax=Mycobacterium paragordonae TaxID=1389713 RepID=A0AAJ1W6P0_9MYCO|nr:MULTISPECIES: hypothetical protein [Mycobacterium]MDP7739413.1 hypothetical protein [Mycobacterium paragordonae]RUP05535.1 MAG: hypothetical protein EKK34_08395 [Mycobacterium sp.]